MARNEHELAQAPSMTQLFARAALGMVPGASALAFAGGGGSRTGEDALVLAGRRIDRDRLAAYDRVCGFDLSDVVPATYPHILAFPLQLALMTSSAFPVPAVGLVHIANRIVQHRPILASERLSLRVWATPLVPDPRGRRFTLRSEAWAGAEKVWEESSLNLARGRRDDTAEAPEGPPDSAALPQTALWRLPADLGRRYGSVSGDMNPIHVHPLSARLFGFPSAISHGMWTQARCLAQLGRELPESFTVEVAFKRPILLPAKVGFVEEAPQAGGTIAFGVRSTHAGTVHLNGLLTL